MIIDRHMIRCASGSYAGLGLKWSVYAFVALTLLLKAFDLKAAQLTEYQVKAAFLLNFAKFVEWPPKAYPDATAPLLIGIVGENPFGGTLAQIVQGQTAQGRRIEIRQFKAGEDCSGCQVLFLSRSVTDQADDILKRLQDRAVLTVGESQDFVRRGGVIGFAMVDKSVRFDVNTQAAEAVELRVSSKLLAVARSVLKTP